MLWGKEKTVETQQIAMLDESQLSVFYPKVQEFLNQVNQIVLDKNTLYTTKIDNSLK